MEDEDELSMAALPPGGASSPGLAGVAADFEAAMPGMLADSQKRREAAYRPLRQIYEGATERLAAKRKALPWHRVALAASEGMVAPMRYGGIGGAMSNVLQRVNPLIEQQEQQSLKYDDQLRQLMMEQAKLDAEIGLDGAKAADKLSERAWMLKRDANKPQWARVPNASGGFDIIPMTPGGVAPQATPKYLAYARGPNGRIGFDGTNWVPVPEEE